MISQNLLKVQMRGGGDEEYSMPGKGKGKGEGIGEAVDDGEGLASALAQLVV